MRGTIRRRGKNSFELKFDLGRVGGKRQTRYVTVKGSLKDAQRELTRLLHTADDGTFVDPTTQTIGKYLTAWLNSALTQSPKTLERYRQLARLQIIPHLGEIKLQKLRPEHLEQWHAALLATDLSARTVSHAHKVLGAALKQAVENGTLARNVAAIRKPPSVEQQEIEILNPDQIKTVLDGLAGHALHPIASLALATGMRRGELLAVQWSDVDLDRAVLRVERSVEETRSGLRVKPPKTKRGRRNIGLPPEAVAMLREHRKAQTELRLKLGQGGQPVLVFSDTEGKMLSPNGVSRSWRQTCEARKLPRVPFHALRHTHASTLLRAGVDVLTVSRRLGHSSPSMTLDVYGHLIEGADAAAAKAIEGVLGKWPPATNSIL
jgi:integrase